MERVLNINGIDVKLKATANVPRLYRVLFNRDIYKDIMKLKKDIEYAQKNKKSMPIKSLELFENVAYAMAFNGDKKNTPRNIDSWLDQFETFDIYEIFPEIFKLWGINEETHSEAKKKTQEE